MPHPDSGIRPPVLSTLAVAAALSAAACTGLPRGLPPLSGMQSEARQAAAPQIIYRFTPPDARRHGWAPGALMTLGGRLYGTTSWGGETNEGAVVTIDASGNGEHIVYSFEGPPDGALAGAPPIDFNGTLYGTTVEGGLYNLGTVYGVTLDGKERTLHSFGAGHDGANPSAHLTELNGNLYGTTVNGGAFNDSGTVFEVSTDGTERVLHSFGSVHRDYAAQPEGGLVALNGKLYGVAEYAKRAWGTIFELSPSGRYRNLHNFSIAEGGPPAGELTALRGSLYGATHGEYDSHRDFRKAVVYEFRPPSMFRVVARVGNATGGSPEDLTVFDGTLYGVSSGGGGYRYGDVLEISTSGTVRVVCAFGGSAGRGPSRLTVLNGLLFGAMGFGGRTRGDGGTIYDVNL